MKNERYKESLSRKELLFQVILHFLVFIFFSAEKNQTYFSEYKVAYFVSYAAAAAFINYFLLPRFYYQKKQWYFFVFVVLTVVAVLLFEEFILEQIYFPGKRAKIFRGGIYSISQILPVIVILSGFKFAWDALLKQNEVESLRSAVKESELQFLKSQINPHFLFNNLNNLYSYAIENSPKTPEIILELSGVLRYMLYECKEDYVSLSKEVAQMKNFVKLSEMQIEERGEVNFKSENISAGYKIAPLILMVFIENAFKHSTGSQSNGIFINVDLLLNTEGRLSFYCKNTFKEKSNTEVLPHGIGLENVRKRLELLYPNAHQLDIKEGNDTYEVYLTMTLNKTE